MTVLKFYIQPSWDAQEHAVFVQAPDDWDTMTPEERIEFERDEVQAWISNEIEAGIVAFASVEELNEHQRGAWGAKSADPDELEKWYD